MPDLSPLLAAGLSLVLAATALPTTGPLPEQKPAESQEAQPGEKPGENRQKADEKTVGEEKPDEQGKPAETPQAEKPQADTPTEIAIPGPAPEKPGDYDACLVLLSELGAKFSAIDPIDDGKGCGIARPIKVDEALPGLSLGGAVMRCRTALATARWLKMTVQPALDLASPGRRITGITPGSTYDCRLRNSAATGKISEHARGNALDVAAFRLDDGSRIEMKPRDEDSTLDGAFQRTATAGACLHFTTVLSPGSDAAHMDHLHLDILERRNGYRYCR